MCRCCVVKVFNAVEMSLRAQLDAKSDQSLGLCVNLVTQSYNYYEMSSSRSVYFLPLFVLN